MALTTTQVSQLYVVLFGRASEGEGNKNWVNHNKNMIDTAALMLDTDAAKNYFGEAGKTNYGFVEVIYKNTLGFDNAADIAAWAANLDNGMSRAKLVTLLLEEALSSKYAGGAPQNKLINRIDVSDYMANNVETVAAENVASTQFQSLVHPNGKLVVTDDKSTVSSAKSAIDEMSGGTVIDGETFTLTNGSDKATANIFNADMVYTPDGSDRILSLQDEDELTGEAGRTDNTLNVEMGNMNADEGTTAVVTPTLNNIQKLNIDWTGNTNTMDLRYSDSVDSIYINKITQDANAVTLNNIATLASDLKVKNVYDNTSTQTFTYVRGVLEGSSDTMALELDNVLTSSITVQSGVTVNEGFETVALTVSNGVDVDTLFSVEDMENLVVDGSGHLDILNQVWTSNEYNRFTAALANPNSIGQRNIDLTDFTGTSNIDISINLGRNVDPNNSGAPYYGVTTGGTGDDTFHTGNVAVAALATDSVQNIIDGGAGDNTLVSYGAGIAGVRGTAGDSRNVADINNIQTLEIRDQVAVLGNYDMDAFDAELTSIFMRDEDAGATTFTLTDMTVEQAATAMTLAHAITVAGAQTVDAALKVATGASDTMAINVVNDLNTGTTFNYTLDFKGEDTDGIAATVNTGVAATSDADAVENVTINDNDTESNIVTLTNIINHDGTTTLTGGTDGTTFTVAGTLNSAVVDASAQLSDLRLTVGDTVGTITTITQDIKLGEGDDVLTYANIDELDATDSLTDAGGNDTVRAAFANDSSIDVAGIENLHVTATANVTLDMANADVTNLVLLANSASSGGADLSNNGTANINIAGGSLAANVITLDNSTLTQLNFFGDADTNDVGADDVTAHIFNGVTLTNNTATNITANINTSLDYNSTLAGSGAATYTIGQITTHGNTGMEIVVGNERANGSTTTTINNIYAKAMTTLTASATGNLTLGTVSGAPLNNSLTTFDMSNVAGVVTANVISLGDNAVVTLADANNVVSALGSAGKDVVMTAGNGNNTLTGTAQDDTITTGSGWDTIAADRGDNVVTAGAGNDTVTAKDGSDTVDLGTGIDTYADNIGTGISGATATNSVSMSGGISTVSIAHLGAAATVVQNLAVGAGSDLTVSWLGNTMNAATAVLDGKLAQVDAMVMTAGSDLVIQTAAGVDTVAASNGNDVYITTTATGSAVNFSGGAGNDAVVGSDGTDILNGGTGADKLVLQNTTTLDADSDAVVIADGDSTASAYDQVFGFDAAGVAGIVVAAAANAGTNVGDDYLDLDLAFATTVGAVNGTDTGGIMSHNVTAAGLITFDTTNNVYGAGTVTAVGTGATQVSLANALAYIAANTVAGNTYVFQYDANGDGLMTAADSTFVFQDGSSDTVVELVGINAIGAEAVTSGTVGLIEIA